MLIITLIYIAAGIVAGVAFMRPEFAFLAVLAAWMFTMLTLFYIAGLRRLHRGMPPYTNNSRGNNDLLEPWMHTNMYMNSQSMRRDINRMAQLAEEQAIRDQLKK